MKEKRLDVQCAGFLLLDDSDFSSLPLLRFGCEKCKTSDEYCVGCTLKLYEVLNSEKYAEFYAKPEKERHEIFVTLENEWVAQNQNAQQSVHLTGLCSCGHAWDSHNENGCCWDEDCDCTQPRR